MSNSKVEVTGILDQTTQSVIVLFLGVGILWHAFMIMPVSVRENSKSGIGPLATTRTRAVKSRMSWKTARQQDCVMLPLTVSCAMWRLPIWNSIIFRE